MHIWLIQTGEIIPKSKDDRYMRTALLAEELASRGHKVIWWTSAYEHQRKKWIDRDEPSFSIHKNVKLVFLKGIGYKQNVSIKRFLDHLIIANKFTKKAKNYPKPDIIINSLPEHNLAYKVQKYAEKINIPTFVDLRDFWPDFMLHFFQNKFLKNIIRLILTRDFYRSRYVLKNANVLISMMKSMFEWGIARGKRKPNDFDQVFYIGSSKPNMNLGKSFSGEFKDLLSKIAGKFNILFIGTFTKTNNPSFLINFAKIYNKNSKLSEKTNFILAGNGNLFEQIKADSSEIDNIYLPGWVNTEQINKLLEISSIGLIPINSDEEFFPNKAFLYFSGGLPIFSSAKGEISKLIDKQELGYNIDIKKPGQIVEKIRYCIENPQILEKMSNNVLKIFSEQFDSDVIYKNYADLIEKFVSDSKI